MIQKYEHYQSPYDEVVIDNNDYLQVSAIIKALETKMITQAQFDRMIEAADDEDVLKILTEADYDSFDLKNPDEMNAALNRHRKNLFAYLTDCVPDERYFDIFKLKYDYHNAKTFLKAKAAGINADALLSENGRVPAEILKEALEGGDRSCLPTEFADAVAGAEEVLDTTGDSQLMDVLLDRLMLEEEMHIAMATGSKFLMRYVEVVLDDTNLKAAVRSLRMGKNAEFLQNVLVHSYGVSSEDIMTAVRNSGVGLAELYAPTLLAEAAEVGQSAIKGGSLTKFERLCDDARFKYLEDAQFKAFGEEPLVGYLAEIETEIKNIRIIIMSRNAGIAPDVIRARLRATYA